MFQQFKPGVVHTPSFTSLKLHVLHEYWSTNIHLLLTSFYQPTKKKYKILCERNLFPSDLYILQSQVELKGFNIADAIIFLPSNSHGVVSHQDIYDTIEANKDELAMIFIVLFYLYLNLWGIIYKTIIKITIMSIKSIFNIFFF